MEEQFQFQFEDTQPKRPTKACVVCNGTGKKSAWDNPHSKKRKLITTMCDWCSGHGTVYVILNPTNR